MVSRTPDNNENERPEDPKEDPFKDCNALTGVSITIAKPEEGSKTHTVLGVVVAANQDKLKEALQAIHSEQLSVQMRHVKPTQIKILK